MISLPIRKESDLRYVLIVTSLLDDSHDGGPGLRESFFCDDNRGERADALGRGGETNIGTRRLEH